MNVLFFSCWTVSHKVRQSRRKGSGKLMNSLLIFVISYAKFLKHRHMISNAATVTNFMTILKKGNNLIFQKQSGVMFSKLALK